jgi:FkbM family methyltransferase
MKDTLKKIIKSLPIAFTQNQRYDRLTHVVIQKVCKRDSNCIDIGCHKGEVLDIMRRYAPEGKHYGFEPIPALFDSLSKKYGDSCVISNIALSNVKGTSSFNYVVSNPSYSGLIKRKYDRSNEKDTLIEVQTDLLDNVLPTAYKPHLIKIDVEGGELQVLEGAKETLAKHKPMVIFEHGLGASEFYNASPDKVYNLLNSCGLRINLLSNWLENKAPLSQPAFEEQFYKILNYYFIAF